LKEEVELVLLGVLPGALAGVALAT